MDSKENKAYAVNWSNYMNHVRKAFDNLLSSNEFVDVTLYCEGKKLRAHQMLLASCSNYFRNIFKEVCCKHPVIVLKGVKYEVLVDIVQFIYNGEVSVDTENFNSFLKTAEMLEISGLTDSHKSSENERVDDISEENLSSPKREKQNEERNLDCDSISIEPARKKPKQKKIDDFLKDEASDELMKTEMLDIPAEINLFSSFEDTFDSNVNSDEILQEGPSQRFSDDFLVTSRGTKESFLTNISKLPYECNICGKRYQLKDSVLKHKMVHTGGTKCPICSKVLSRKTHLDRHLLTTHSIPKHS